MEEQPDLSSSGAQRKKYTYSYVNEKGEQKTKNCYRTVTHDKKGRPKTYKGDLRKEFQNISEEEARLLLKTLEIYRAANQHAPLSAIEESATE
jgi:uncharacterized protein YfbU (UPF0304 family)